MPFYEIGSHKRKVFVMQDKKCTILFQGDSITDCGRASCGGAGFSNDGLGPGYPGLIAARLLCNRPEVSWKFINRGISGSRTVDLYARWKIDGINLKPDIITILVGINDTWHRYCGDNGVELERAERIYREILSWTLEQLPGVHFILMEPFALKTGTLSEEDIRLQEVAARGRFVKKLAGEFRTGFIPCQELFDHALRRAPMKHWLHDGVHPTPAGHQLLADAWLEAAKPLLP